MTVSDIPSSGGKPPIDDLAPTPVDVAVAELTEAVEAEEEDSEGDGGEGKKGSGDGGKKAGGKKKSVDAEPDEALLSEENLEDYDSEKLIEKLKLLVWAPFSMMVPGASSFESESDLKKKLFLGQVGMINNQLEAKDIADPDLVAKLEKRNQERQLQNKIDMGTVTSSSAADLGGLVTGLEEVPEAVQKKAEMKQQLSQPKEASFDSHQETYDDDQSEDGEYKQTQKTEQVFGAEPDNDLEVADSAYESDVKGPEAKDDGMALREVAELFEPIKREQERQTEEALQEAVHGLDEVDPISSLFNAFAQQVEAVLPSQKTELKFADPAPKFDTAAPKGGV